MIQFYVPKTLGYPIVNLLRQFSLSETEVVRIAGFSLGEQEMLRSGDIDLVKVSAILSNLDIEFDEVDSYPTVKTVRFTEVLTVGDLRRAGVLVKNVSDDIQILNGFKPGTISLILNKYKHYMTASNNKSLLESGQMFDISGYNIIPCRGSNIDVEFDIIPGLESDLVKFNVKSEDEIRIINQTLGNISSVIDGIRSKIS